MIKINYLGRLGNNLFQYCLGRILANEFDTSLKTKRIEGFLAATPIKKRLQFPTLKKDILTGHSIDLKSITQNRKRRNIVLNGFFQRYEYYKNHKSDIKDWLFSNHTQILGDRDLTISVRSGDIWQNKNNTTIHPNYCALPFSYYKNIIDSHSWEQIYIVTDNANDPMVRKLSDKFSAQGQSKDPVSDFNLIRSSTNIVLPVSTFAWWAAWLSNAQKIFYPKVAVFDPSVRPDINLIVDNEDRYEYISLQNTMWKGSEDERKALLFG